MPAPIIPWAPSNIPKEIQDELNRRKVNRSFKYVSNNIANWEGGDWNQYRGPMVSWVRVCSNGRGRQHIDKSKNRPRFVLYGGRGFYQTYGFTPNKVGSGYQIIGYTPGETGGQGPQPHIIENSLNSPESLIDSGGHLITKGNYPIHVPNPEISRVECIIQKELFRKATIEWTCFSWKQLEYMAPYFLVPGISVLIEWGWNHFNPASLVDLSNKVKLKELWNNSYPLYFDNIIWSKGNYDVVYGIITNFNWSIDGNKINCTTEVSSKDRLYAGIAKNSITKVNIQDEADKKGPPGILMSIKDFFDKGTIKNLKTIAASDNPQKKVIELSNPVFQSLSDGSAVSSGGTSINNQHIYDIIINITSNKNKDIRRKKLSYIHGVFWGRKKLNETDGSLYYSVARPKKTDFDFNEGDITNDSVWINMGLVVEILNYFSTKQGVGKENMFTVDITSTIISGHPNLISCDRRVLIPNYKAPKYHWGWIGRSTNGGTMKNPPKNSKGQTSTYSNVSQTSKFGGLMIPGAAFQFSTPSNSNEDGSEYLNQYPNGSVAQGKADDIIGRVLYQYQFNGNLVFRNDLDKWINWYRYKMIRENPKQKEHYYSFPAGTEEEIEIEGSDKKLKIEPDWSGLLSNIYISIAALTSIIDNENVLSYKDIYEKILTTLMEASNYFWDLVLVENEGKMVIVDRNYISKDNLQDGNPLWIFDYQDSDSIIKSLRFQPQLTDAQATRAIYGIVNNPETVSKYSSVDNGDLLPYFFKDDIVLPEEDRKDGGKDSKINTQKEYYAHLRSILADLQVIDKNSHEFLQMTVPSPNPGQDEVIKLIMPNSELLKLILHDGDIINNPMYCAIQPNITLEMTLQGIGGLRTWQYFLIRGLPEPYSHRNVIFRITDVIQTLEAGKWETTIRAGLLPLTDYIKLRVSPEGGWDVPVKTN